MTFRTRVSLLCAIPLMWLVGGACGGTVVEPGQQQPSGDGGGGTGGTSNTGGAAGAPEGGSAGQQQAGGAAGNVATPGPGTPPSQPESGSEPVGPGAVLAIRRMFLGEIDSQGNPSTDAWMKTAYDLDGLTSTKDSANHCQLQAGANPSRVKTDGLDGVDNSFGKNLAPVFANMMGGWSNAVNDLIAEGDFTGILAVDGLGAAGDYVSLPAAYYSGGPLGFPPSWDGTDTWPVPCLGLQICQPSATPAPPANPSLFRFPQSWVNAGVWVSGPPTQLTFRIGHDWLNLELKLKRAVVTMRLDDSSPAPETANGGIIAGILDTEEFIEGFKEIAGHISPSLCEGPTMDSIAQQFRAASDILVNGTQDANLMCNGVSVGIGFEAQTARLGPALNQPEPQPDPCF